MKKAVFPLLAALLLAGSCGKQRPDALSSATRRKGPTARTLLARYMPETMSDGIVKAAIVRNLSVEDHSRQFLEGCVSEGRSMGFTVDTFVTGGDNTRCRELIRQIAAADYDGLILSHGGADFTYGALQPALERGMKIVTFDALPYRDGDPARGIMPGVTSTAQEDAELARSSLQAILDHFEGKRPVRIIRAWSGPGIPPLDRRQRVYDEMVREGKIEEVALVSPADFSFARQGVRDEMRAALSRFPRGTVDAIWAPYDEFAKGCADALYEAGRLEITLASVDISNDDINLMLDRSAVWLCTAAADPRLIGIGNMRLLAAKFAGEQTPESYAFTPQLIYVSRLNRTATMENLAFMVPGWGREAGLFDQYPWMAELKAAERAYLRLPPLAAR
jgi:simple sugar transport system substrate-binding protein